MEMYSGSRGARKSAGDIIRAERPARRAVTGKLCPGRRPGSLFRLSRGSLLPPAAELRAAPMHSPGDRPARAFCNSCECRVASLAGRADSSGTCLRLRRESFSLSPPPASAFLRGSGRAPGIFHAEAAARTRRVC